MHDEMIPEKSPFTAKHILSLERVAAELLSLRNTLGDTADRLFGCEPSDPTIYNTCTDSGVKAIPPANTQIDDSMASIFRRIEQIANEVRRLEGI